MRTHEHITDTKSIKKVLNILPDHWVVRELSERDYGIDLLIEIFHQSGDDQNGNPQYESSGCVVNIQVKGTSKNLRFNRDGTLHYSMKKKALKYMSYRAKFLLNTPI